jgi:hypothetical protein
MPTEVRRIGSGTWTILFVLVVLILAIVYLAY